MGLNRTYRSSSAAPAAGGVGMMHSGAQVAKESGRGGVASTSQWTPTVANLLILVVLEIAAFAAIRYTFKIVNR